MNNVDDHLDLEEREDSPTQSIPGGFPELRRQSYNGTGEYGLNFPQYYDEEMLLSSPELSPTREHSSPPPFSVPPSREMSTIDTPLPTNDYEETSSNGRMAPSETSSRARTTSDTYLSRPHILDRFVSRNLSPFSYFCSYFPQV